MRDSIKLLTEIVGLAAAVIVLLAALNKTGTVEVPVIRDIPALQPPPPSPEPTPTEPTTETVLVPDVVGVSQQDAETKLDEVGLEIQGVDKEATELCEHESGVVEATLPPAGASVSQGSGVRLTVCE
jgi:PASTA domain